MAITLVTIIAIQLSLTRIATSTLQCIHTDRLKHNYYHG